MVSDRIVDFRFFVKFHRSGPAIFSVFELSQNMLVMNQKSSSSSKRPHQLGVYYSGILWMVSDRIVDFRFFVKFHRSGPAIFSVFELS